ncbi:MAG TPA: hypothetical protein VKS78_13920 [Roseiarcus sp.]|nr:hypothetical protein [Roseiarcus sp.]
MARNSPVGRLALLALGAAASCAMASATAFADASCADDLKKLTDRRMTELNALNAMAETSKKEKKPVDAGVFCVKAHGLSAAEEALIAYMEKNKDWCSIPDEVMANLKASHAKSLEFGNRACVAAAKAKKMQEEQAAGGGPQAQPLPAGPL